ncbi:MAG: DUF2203 family protein [bacterium]|nr:DUF2203 family protein [Candidatus Aquidulcis sp.]
MRGLWTVDAATRELARLRPLIALMRGQRIELERMKDDLLRLRRLERMGALPGGADQNQLQPADLDPTLREALASSSVLELRIRAAVDQMQASVDRFTSRGVELRDIDRGLVDFPASAFGIAFLLCWEESDGDEVGFAHQMGDGYSARLPIAEFLRRLAAHAEGEHP